jgi:ribosomal protein L22
MADEQEKPKRRRSRKAEAAPDAEATKVTPADEAARTETGTAADDEATRAASSSDATSEQASDIVEPTAEDIEAEEATEVVLEADDEAEGDTTPTEGEEQESEADAAAEEAPKPRRRRRGAAAAEEKTEAPAKPAPSRRRSRERPAGPPPVVRAQAKYVRSSARKARLVCDHIRGKTVEEARAILAVTPRAIARDWSKLLESAVANAEHNHELVGEDLYVKAVHADEGPTIKRFRPRAMGRATRIRKRTSHLTILLTPKD